MCRASDVRRGIGSDPRCNGTSSALDCVPVCKDPSHIVDVKDKLVLKCRNGEWDSERRKVAPCTCKATFFNIKLFYCGFKVTSPFELRVTSKSTLNSATCLSQSAISDLKSLITTNTGALQCSTDASCQTTVHVQSDGCGVGGRTLVRITATITLTSNISAGDLQLAEFVTSKTVSPQLQKLIDAVKVLEKSAQQLQTSSSIYDVTMGGTQYSVVKDGVTVTSGVQCPAAAAVRNMLCVYCSPGTYSQGNKCTFCEVGTYQDEIGKGECKQCPFGRSTEFTGSTGVNECTVSVDGNDNDDDDVDDDDERNKNIEDTRSLIAGLAVGLAGAFVVIAALVAIVFSEKKKTWNNTQKYNSC
ncbi:uncharacterized protein LOC121383215 isoform X2 [Gigantopelta aegis]|uniref:uncharacterized protein LOC121383215 isoform X2 n=1 Tax=Gigantopelta aegis TaxID=1735272 RepID=UPI001B88D2C7|nr:uncharacterized protein LOC121383215 isoform X2 [Gigantopelta aegis]